MDAFQGGEKEIIFLSCCRSSGLGFTASPNRMNVAITRARRHLVVVGNAKMLSENEHWKQIVGRAGSLPGGRRNARQFQVLLMTISSSAASPLSNGPPFVTCVTYHLFHILLQASRPTLVVCPVSEEEPEERQDEDDGADETPEHVTQSTMGIAKSICEEESEDEDIFAFDIAPKSKAPSLNERRAGAQNRQEVEGGGGEIEAGPKEEEPVETQNSDQLQEEEEEEAFLRHVTHTATAQSQETSQGNTHLPRGAVPSGARPPPPEGNSKFKVQALGTATPAPAAMSTRNIPSFDLGGSDSE